MRKTGISEGVDRKTKGLSVSFNIECKHDKQIVGLTRSVSLFIHRSMVTCHVAPLHVMKLRQ